MSDDLTKKIPQDANRINLNQSWEVEYWCSELNCTEDELREAVEKVGDSVDAVREYLVEKRQQEAEMKKKVKRQSGWSR